MPKTTGEEMGVQEEKALEMERTQAEKASEEKAKQTKAETEAKTKPMETQEMEGSGDPSGQLYCWGAAIGMWKRRPHRRTLLKSH